MLVRITYPVVQWVQWKPNTAKITKRGVCGCERCGQVLWRLASIVVITPQYTDALEVSEEMLLEYLLICGHGMLLGFGGEFLLGTWVAAPLPAVGSVWASVRIQPTWWWCNSGSMMAAPLLAVGSVFSMWAVSVPLAPIQPTWVGFRRWSTAVTEMVSALFAQLL